jgi:hypothetical protein
MSRRLAHRPHYHLLRPTPRHFSQSHQGYLRQRRVYRQQNFSYLQRPPGYSLSLVPWGWKLARPEIRCRA